MYYAAALVSLSKQLSTCAERAGPSMPIASIIRVNESSSVNASSNSSLRSAFWLRNLQTLEAANIDMSWVQTQVNNLASVTVQIGKAEEEALHTPETSRATNNAIIEAIQATIGMVAQKTIEGEEGGAASQARLQKATKAKAAAESVLTGMKSTWSCKSDATQKAHLTANPGARCDSVATLSAKPLRALNAQCRRELQSYAMLEFENTLAAFSEAVQRCDTLRPFTAESKHISQEFETASQEQWKMPAQIRAEQILRTAQAVVREIVADALMVARSKPSFVSLASRAQRVLEDLEEAEEQLASSTSMYPVVSKEGASVMMKAGITLQLAEASWQCSTAAESAIMQHVDLTAVSSEACPSTAAFTVKAGTNIAAAGAAAWSSEGLSAAFVVEHVMQTSACQIKLAADAAAAYQEQLSTTRLAFVGGSLQNCQTTQSPAVSIMEIANALGESNSRDVAGRLQMAEAHIFAESHKVTQWTSWKDEAEKLTAGWTSALQRAEETYRAINVAANGTRDTKSAFEMLSPEDKRLSKVYSEAQKDASIASEVRDERGQKVDEKQADVEALTTQLKEKRVEAEYETFSSKKNKKKHLTGAVSDTEIAEKVSSGNMLEAKAKESEVKHERAHGISRSAQQAAHSAEQAMLAQQSELAKAQVQAKEAKAKLEEMSLEAGSQMSLSELNEQVEAATEVETQRTQAWTKAQAEAEDATQKANEAQTAEISLLSDTYTAKQGLKVVRQNLKALEEDHKYAILKAKELHAKYTTGIAQVKNMPPLVVPPEATALAPPPLLVLAGRTSRSVSLQWAAFSVATTSTLYDIQFKVAGGSPWTTAGMRNSTTLIITVPQLLPGIEYAFRIRCSTTPDALAKDTEAWTEWSDGSVTATTLGEPWSCPSELSTASGSTTGSMKIGGTSCTAGVSMGGVIASSQTGGTHGLIAWKPEGDSFGLLVSVPARASWKVLDWTPPSKQCTWNFAAASASMYAEALAQYSKDIGACNVKELVPANATAVQETELALEHINTALANEDEAKLAQESATDAAHVVERATAALSTLSATLSSKDMSGDEMASTYSYVRKALQEGLVAAQTAKLAAKSSFKSGSAPKSPLLAVDVNVEWKCSSDAAQQARIAVTAKQCAAIIQFKGSVTSAKKIDTGCQMELHKAAVVAYVSGLRQYAKHLEEECPSAKSQCMLESLSTQLVGQSAAQEVTSEEAWYPTQQAKLAATTAHLRAVNATTRTSPDAAAALAAAAGAKIEATRDVYHLAERTASVHLRDTTAAVVEAKAALEEFASSSERGSWRCSTDQAQTGNVQILGATGCPSGLSFSSLSKAKLDEKCELEFRAHAMKSFGEALVSYSSRVEQQCQLLDPLACHTAAAAKQAITARNAAVRAEEHQHAVLLLEDVQRVVAKTEGEAATGIVTQEAAARAQGEAAGALMIAAAGNPVEAAEAAAQAARSHNGSVAAQAAAAGATVSGAGGSASDAGVAAAKAATAAGASASEAAAVAGKAAGACTVAAGGSVQAVATATQAASKAEGATDEEAAQAAGTAAGTAAALKGQSASAVAEVAAGASKAAGGSAEAQARAAETAKAAGREAREDSAARLNQAGRVIRTMQQTLEAADTANENATEAHRRGQMNPFDPPQKRRLWICGADTSVRGWVAILVAGNCSQDCRQVSMRAEHVDGTMTLPCKKEFISDTARQYGEELIRFAGMLNLRKKAQKFPLLVPAAEAYLARAAQDDAKAQRTQLVQAQRQVQSKAAALAQKALHATNLQEVLHILIVQAGAIEKRALELSPANELRQKDKEKLATTKAADIAAEEALTFTEKRVKETTLNERLLEKSSAKGAVMAKDAKELLLEVQKSQSQLVASSQEMKNKMKIAQLKSDEVQRALKHTEHELLMAKTDLAIQAVVDSRLQEKELARLVAMLGGSKVVCQAKKQMNDDAQNNCGLRGTRITIAKADLKSTSNQNAVLTARLEERINAVGYAKSVKLKALLDRQTAMLVKSKITLETLLSNLNKLQREADEYQIQSDQACNAADRIAAENDVMLENLKKTEVMAARQQAAVILAQASAEEAGREEENALANEVRAIQQRAADNILKGALYECATVFPTKDRLSKQSETDLLVLLQAHSKLRGLQANLEAQRNKAEQLAEQCEESGQARKEGLCDIARVAKQDQEKLASHVKKAVTAVGNFQEGIDHLQKQIQLVRIAASKCDKPPPTAAEVRKFYEIAVLKQSQCKLKQANVQGLVEAGALPQTAQAKSKLSREDCTNAIKKVKDSKTSGDDLTISNAEKWAQTACDKFSADDRAAIEERKRSEAAQETLKQAQEDANAVCMEAEQKTALANAESASSGAESAQKDAHAKQVCGEMEKQKSEASAAEVDLAEAKKAEAAARAVVAEVAKLSAEADPSSDEGLLLQSKAQYLTRRANKAKTNVFGASTRVAREIREAEDAANSCNEATADAESVAAGANVVALEAEQHTACSVSSQKQVQAKAAIAAAQKQAAIADAADAAAAVKGGESKEAKQLKATADAARTAVTEMSSRRVQVAAEATSAHVACVEATQANQAAQMSSRAAVKEQEKDRCDSSKATAAGRAEDGAQQAEQLAQKADAALEGANAHSAALNNATSEANATQLEGLKQETGELQKAAALLKKQADVAATMASRLSQEADVQAKACKKLDAEAEAAQCEVFSARAERLKAKLLASKESAASRALEAESAQERELDEAEVSEVAVEAAEEAASLAKGQGDTVQQKKLEEEAEALRRTAHHEQAEAGAAAAEAATLKREASIAAEAYESSMAKADVCKATAECVSSGKQRDELSVVQQREQEEVEAAKAIATTKEKYALSQAQTADAAEAAAAAASNPTEATNLKVRAKMARKTATDARTEANDAHTRLQWENLEAEATSGLVAQSEAESTAACAKAEAAKATNQAALAAAVVLQQVMEAASTAETAQRATDEASSAKAAADAAETTARVVLEQGDEEKATELAEKAAVLRKVAQGKSAEAEALVAQASASQAGATAARLSVVEAEAHVSKAMVQLPEAEAEKARVQARNAREEEAAIPVIAKAIQQIQAANTSDTVAREAAEVSQGDAGALRTQADAQLPAADEGRKQLKSEKRVALTREYDMKIVQADLAVAKASIAAAKATHQNLQAECAGFVNSTSTKLVADQLAGEVVSLQDAAQAIRREGIEANIEAELEALAAHTRKKVGAADAAMAKAKEMAEQAHQARARGDAGAKSLALVAERAMQSAKLSKEEANVAVAVQEAKSNELSAVQATAATQKAAQAQAAALQATAVSQAAQEAAQQAAAEGDTEKSKELQKVAAALGKVAEEKQAEAVAAVAKEKEAEAAVAQASVDILQANVTGAEAAQQGNASIVDTPSQSCREFSYDAALFHDLKLDGETDDLLIAMEHQKVSTSTRIALAETAEADAAELVATSTSTAMQHAREQGDQAQAAILRVQLDELINDARIQRMKAESAVLSAKAQHLKAIKMENDQSIREASTEAKKKDAEAGAAEDAAMVAATGVSKAQGQPNRQKMAANAEVARRQAEFARAEAQKCGSVLRKATQDAAASAAQLLGAAASLDAATAHVHALVSVGRVIALNATGSIEGNCSDHTQKCMERSKAVIEANLAQTKADVATAAASNANLNALKEISIAKVRASDASAAATRSMSKAAVAAHEARKAAIKCIRLWNGDSAASRGKRCSEASTSCNVAAARAQGEVESLDAVQAVAQEESAAATDAADSAAEDAAESAEQEKRVAGLSECEIKKHDAEHAAQKAKYVFEAATKAHASAEHGLAAIHAEQGKVTVTTDTFAKEAAEAAHASAEALAKQQAAGAARAAGNEVEASKLDKEAEAWRETAKKERTEAELAKEEAAVVRDNAVAARSKKSRAEMDLNVAVATSNAASTEAVRIDEYCRRKAEQAVVDAAVEETRLKAKQAAEKVAVSDSAAKAAKVEAAEAAEQGMVAKVACDMATAGGAMDADALCKKSAAEAEAAAKLAGVAIELEGLAQKQKEDAEFAAEELEKEEKQAEEMSAATDQIEADEEAAKTEDNAAVKDAANAALIKLEDASDNDAKAAAKNDPAYATAAIQMSEFDANAVAAAMEVDHKAQIKAAEAARKHGLRLEYDIDARQKMYYKVTSREDFS